MKDLLGSCTKEKILLYLGLRGGASGRRLARILKISPTQIFKALRQLERVRLIIRQGIPSFYALNPHYLYYDEVIRMIYKKSQTFRPPYLPRLSEDRKVDPFAVYEVISLIGPKPNTASFAGTFLKNYVGKTG